MDYATAAKEIVKAIQKADAEMKKRIRKMMKQRTLEDVAVLQTMLGMSAAFQFFWELLKFKVIFESGKSSSSCI